MNEEERNQFAELSRKYCELSIEHDWCDKHDCDYCYINNAVNDMLENIDSVTEE